MWTPKIGEIVIGPLDFVARLRAAIVGNAPSLVKRESIADRNRLVPGEAARVTEAIRQLVPDPRHAKNSRAPPSSRSVRVNFGSASLAFCDSSGCSALGVSGRATKVPVF